MLDSSDAKRSTALVVIATAAIAAILPAMLYGVPFSRDLYHHFRLAIAFYDAVQHSDGYPGWLAQANNSFGEVSPRFYPPGLSYLLVIGRVVLGNWYGSALLAFVVLTFVGGVGAYFWARVFMPRTSAMWAGVLYIFTPYHLNELYQSSLLAEYAAAAILPFAFGFIDRICRGGGRRDVAGLGASYAALVLTHTPLTVIGSYALLAYALLALGGTNRKLLRNTITQLTAGLGLGLMASACFWITVLAELQWLRPDIEPQNVFSWRMFLFSSFDSNTNNIWYGNLIAVATLFVALPALVRPRNKNMWGFVVGSLLMATLITYPLWQVLPLMKSVQVPWRWLAVTSMAAAVLAAGSIEKLKEMARNGARPLALLAAGCVAGAVAFSLAHPVREARYLSRTQLDSVLQNLELPSIGAWYPRWVAPEYVYTREPVVAEGREVTIAAWESERRRFHIAAGPAREARVRTFYYPLWTAVADGRHLDIRPASDGAMIISIPGEETTIDLVFREPWRSTVGAIATAVGVLAIAAFALL